MKQANGLENICLDSMELGILTAKAIRPIAKSVVKAVSFIVSQFVGELSDMKADRY